jgi:hypothetical protein
MERITITIETGNAAFADRPATEIARILSELASDISGGGLEDGKKLRDTNGNWCGIVRVQKEG